MKNGNEAIYNGKAYKVVSVSEKDMKPVVFNTEMVRAILDDRKINTRRMDKNFPDPNMVQLLNCGTSKNGFLYAHFSNGKAVKAPHKIGDIIYVRETFAVGVPDGTEPESESNPITVFYKADDSVHGWMNEDWDEVNIPWKPSIHMPKEYARLFLRVKDVRIERLNEIREEDAIAEGVEISNEKYNLYKDYSGCLNRCNAICSFETLWESIYGNGSFDNRYVWVTEFERVNINKA